VERRTTKEKQTNYNNLNLNDMFIKLTNANSKRPVVINPSNIHSMYELVDRTNGNFITKINFNENSYIMVNERLEDIYTLGGNLTKGVDQVDIDWTVQTIDERVEESFRPRTYERKPRTYDNNRQRNYNSYNSYNDNGY
jgi:hypothetical protein